MRFRTPKRHLAMLGMVLFVGGCASFDIEQEVAQANRELEPFTDGALALARSDEERRKRREQAEALLAEPLDRDAAVRLALLNSPGVQAMLATRWADAAAVASSGRIPNPVFAFERVETDDGDELEIERVFSFGILDLLTAPWRASVASRRLEGERLALATEVVDRVTGIRQAWTDAVASAERLRYAEQVRDSADASAEMARRMEEVGNFSRLDRARQQLFYATTATALAQARHESRAARETLVRELGLDAEQARQLRLPDRLPDIPDAVLQPEDIAAAIDGRRLDLRLARAELAAAGRALGIGRIDALTDIEIGYVSATTFGDDARESADGYELEIDVPLFDLGGTARAEMNARALAAVNAYTEAVRSLRSSLAESYSGYRTAHDIARHYRDEVLPLTDTISEETVYQYNGMLIGPFELLADTRASVGTVLEAIEAQRAFWHSEAALQAALVGRPAASAVGGAMSGGETPTEQAGH